MKAILIIEFGVSESPFGCAKSVSADRNPDIKQGNLFVFGNRKSLTDHRKRSFTNVVRPLINRSIVSLH